MMVCECGTTELIKQVTFKRGNMCNEKQKVTKKKKQSIELLTITQRANPVNSKKYKSQDHFGWWGAYIEQDPSISFVWICDILNNVVNVLTYGTPKNSLLQVKLLSKCSLIQSWMRKGQSSRRNKIKLQILTLLSY